MNVLETLLRGIVEEPLAEDRWLVLGDWLEEHDDPRRAELLRLHRRLLATCTEPERHPDRAGGQARLVELLSQGVRPCVPQQTVELGRAQMVFNFIPPGTFLMGSPAAEAGRHDTEALHEVALTEGLWLGAHPITQGQWQAVMGDKPGKSKAKDRPVDRMRWDECEPFCAQLKEKVGLLFRLPTEAQWEWACRAGTTTPFFWGDTISSDQAGYRGTYVYGNGAPGIFRRKTTPVGSFAPNAWGLYDMHGQIWEWCWTDGPQGPTGVLRGGCWRAYPVACRSASRYASLDAHRSAITGCRLCLCPA